MDIEFTMAENLGPHQFPRGDLHYFIEYPFANTLDGAFTGYNDTGIDVKKGGRKGGTIV